MLTYVMCVQVRATIEVPVNSTQEQVMALVKANPAIQKWTDVSIACNVCMHTILCVVVFFVCICHSEVDRCEYYMQRMYAYYPVCVCVCVLLCV
jgi:hypothetical protein